MFRFWSEFRSRFRIYGRNDDGADGAGRDHHGARAAAALTDVYREAADGGHRLGRSVRTIEL
jgi:hypothetical protein